MNIYNKFAQLLIIFSLTLSPLMAQSTNSIYFGADIDPCGYDDQTAMQLLAILGPGWGYNYDSLLIDLDKWQVSPFVIIDSIGASVQERTLWRLTITDTCLAKSPRIRISIHSRTHPNEVQSTWVTNAIINLLLADTSLAQLLREKCIFNIVPMYNPDGVELGYGRENANGEDLERNWDNDPMEPETAALKKTFEAYMASESPVRVALNMHSAYSCTRYFVYHHETGTSQAFADDQKTFIGSIRDYWPEGIQNWDYVISWVDNTPIHYPESWFWLNYQEAVMALTYEDMNCDEAGEFDRTANALLSGIKDYLGLVEVPVSPPPVKLTQKSEDFASLSAYPNPLSSGSRLNIDIRFKTFMNYKLAVFNILGQKVAPIQQGSAMQSKLHFTPHLANLSTGVYYLVLATQKGHKVLPFIFLKK